MMTDPLPRVILACATKHPVEIFSRATFLGKSLSGLPDGMRPRLILLTDNIGPGTMGLPEFYNQSIESVEGDAILVFIHDDVYIHDWNLSFTLSQALRSWDLVGAAGSASVPYGQVGWWHELIDGMPFKNDQVRRSGCINHFDPSIISPDYFGPSPMECDLLDGVFMAAKVKTLRDKNLRFDPQFRFHCYDADFCYSARSLGLSIGTWPLLITHGSAGSYYNKEWITSAEKLKLKLNSNSRSTHNSPQTVETASTTYHPEFKTPEFQYHSSH